MSTQKHPKLVLAICLQTRGFAFALFEAWTAPVDWAVHEVRGDDKNARCLKRVNSILALHTPDIVVLQQMPQGDTRRTIRIRSLNRAIVKLAEGRGIAVRMYAQAELRNSFARYYGALTKQRIAETIANHIPALNLYVPPARKPWMSEHERMGLFEAAALAWMHFHNSNRRLRACEKRGCLSDHHECGRLLEIGSIP